MLYVKVFDVSVETAGRRYERWFVDECRLVVPTIHGHVRYVLSLSFIRAVVAAAAAATYTRIPPVSCRVGGVVVKK
jgi:hypothetical protein